MAPDANRGITVALNLEMISADDLFLEAIGVEVLAGKFFSPIS